MGPKPPDKLWHGHGTLTKKDTLNPREKMLPNDAALRGSSCKTYKQRLNAKGKANQTESEKQSPTQMNYGQET